MRHNVEFQFTYNKFVCNIKPSKSDAVVIGLLPITIDTGPALDAGRPGNIRFGWSVVHRN